MFKIKIFTVAAERKSELKQQTNSSVYGELRKIRLELYGEFLQNQRCKTVNGAVKKKRNKSLDSKKHIEYIGGTKSEKGIRIIPLADSLANILKNWRTVCEHDPVGKDFKFIFFDESGDFMKEKCYSSMWGRFIQKNGWTGRNYIVYRFRHAFCTRLLFSGRTLQEVQALMGDSSLDVIIEIYSGIESENVLERSRENVNNIYAIA